MKLNRSPIVSDLFPRRRRRPSPVVLCVVLLRSYPNSTVRDSKNPLRGTKSGRGSAHSGDGNCRESDRTSTRASSSSSSLADASPRVVDVETNARRTSLFDDSIRTRRGDATRQRRISTNARGGVQPTEVAVSSVVFNARDGGRGESDDPRGRCRCER